MNRTVYIKATMIDAYPQNEECRVSIRGMSDDMVVDGDIDVWVDKKDILFDIPASNKAVVINTSISTTLPREEMIAAIDAALAEALDLEPHEIEPIDIENPL